MRIILISIAAIVVSFVGFLTVKFWGQSQPYIEYKHPIYSRINDEPVIFIKPKFENLTTEIETTTDNLFLDVANTMDQKVVLTKPAIQHKYDVRNKMYADIQNDVLLLENFKEHFKNRKIIFNLIESAIAGHEIFVDELKALGLDKGDNLIIVSPYDTLTKSIKELAPTLIYGTSQPENARIKAMESLNLIEAATFRADIVIYPLTYYKQKFFTETLLQELKRRYKKFIVGPISKSDQAEATHLKPFGIIISD